MFMSESCVFHGTQTYLVGQGIEDLVCSFLSTLEMSLPTLLCVQHTHPTMDLQPKSFPTCMAV